MTTDVFLTIARTIDIWDWNKTR